MSSGWWYACKLIENQNALFFPYYPFPTVLPVSWIHYLVLRDGDFHHFVPTPMEYFQAPIVSDEDQPPLSVKNISIIYSEPHNWNTTIHWNKSRSVESTGCSHSLSRNQKEDWRIWLVLANAQWKLLVIWWQLIHAVSPVFTQGLGVVLSTIGVI